MSQGSTKGVSGHPPEHPAQRRARKRKEAAPRHCKSSSSLAREGQLQNPIIYWDLTWGGDRASITGEGGWDSTGNKSWALERRERAVLKRGLMGCGVSLSREEQGKKERSKNCCFFWGQPVGEHREQDMDQLRVWMEDWDVRAEWFSTIPDNQLCPALLLSPVDAE